MSVCRRDSSQAGPHGLGKQVDHDFCHPGESNGAPMITSREPQVRESVRMRYHSIVDDNSGLLSLHGVNRCDLGHLKRAQNAALSHLK